MQRGIHLRGHVLVGPHEDRPEAWVLDGRITYQRPRAFEGDTIEGWVLPGLVDAHCHVGLDAHGAVDDATTERQALAERAAGALLLRDAGSPADTRWIDERDDLPKVIRAGRHIARTRRYIRNYADEIEPDQLVETVRRQARAADGWVKLVGDWIDRDRGDLAPCWPTDGLREAVQAAHDEGARVTAHCFGEEVLHELADSGIDCVEHATGLDAETTDAFAARGIAIVPTLINIDTFPQIAQPAREKFPLYHRHMLELHARRHRTVVDAHEAGVPVFAGTDAGGVLPHGLVAAEVAQLVAAGLPATDAVGAATWSARAWLGRPGIEEGAPADLCVFSCDPREDVLTLSFPVARVLRGRLV